MNIVIDSITQQEPDQVTVYSHDSDSGQSYTNIIGLNPDSNTTIANDDLAYFTTYIESTIPPTPTNVYTNPQG